MSSSKGGWLANSLPRSLVMPNAAMLAGNSPDMRRVNSFFCSTAYPILEQAGQLRRSRLRGGAAPSLNLGADSPSTAGRR